MPYINVRVAGQLERSQKEEIVNEITQLMKRVAGKPESATYVVIDEVPRSNWAKSGELLE
ncbi:4-oxalocrotonate tautomerase [Candidatus Marinamargulisbacteria bacterium SCGC AAA071-K20]|nr:4-oxalocrotonate tautomerase [Candidatus Marinamargulisbacteria bacterium SCGC AAA071-K20]